MQIFERGSWLYNGQQPASQQVLLKHLFFTPYLSLPLVSRFIS
jgi:hypothetical protein